MISLERLFDNSPTDRNFQRLVSLVVDTGGQSVGLRFGTVTLTYTASATSAAATVTHGLGKTPEYIGSLGTTGLSKRHVVNYVSGSRNDTDFQLQAETADSAAVTGSISVFWVVIG